MSKTFSVRSNAIRNARSKLGKQAQQKIDFVVSKNDDGTFSWEPIVAMQNVPGETTMEPLKLDADEPGNLETNAEIEVRERVSKRKASKARKPAAKKAKPASAKAPSAVQKYLRKRVHGADDVSGKRLKLIQMICHPNGASLDVLVNHLGWQKHTIRGAISTANDQKLIDKLESFRDEKRGRVYRAVKVMSDKVKAA